MKKEWMALLREKYSDREVDFSFLEYVMEYQLSAVMGVIKYWLQTGKKLPQQELVRRIYRISENGVFSIVREELGGKAMLSIINRKLREIEEAEQVKIILAVESAAERGDSRPPTAIMMSGSFM